MGMFKRLLERYSELQQQYSLMVATKSINASTQHKVIENGLKLFERLRVILEFYATATGNAEVASKFTLVSTPS